MATEVVDNEPPDCVPRSTHMLTGKAIARAVRGHFLADAVLNAELYGARVATKCKTYRSVQTNYASV